MHLMTWIKDDGYPGGSAGAVPWEQLVTGCKNGDRKAQKRLFDALAPKMLPLCMRYVGDRDTSEDLLQEGFVTLFSRLDSYSGAGSSLSNDKQY